MITAESRPMHGEGVRLRPVGDERILIDPKAGIVFGLNALGSEVWQRLDGRATVRSIAEDLRCDGVEFETLVADVLAFVNDLRRRGLVTSQRPT